MHCKFFNSSVSKENIYRCQSCEHWFGAGPVHLASLWKEPGTSLFPMGRFIHETLHGPPENSNKLVFTGLNGAINAFFLWHVRAPTAVWLCQPVGSISSVAFNAAECDTSQELATRLLILVSVMYIDITYQWSQSTTWFDALTLTW